MTDMDEGDKRQADSESLSPEIPSGKGNILVIGNSGVGKSTLINAVLGEDVAEAHYGAVGTTKELKLYDSESVPFRVIDTVGFEPSSWKSRAAVQAVKKWSRDSAKAGKNDTQINAIWFCVEGTSSKLFDETIKNLQRATSMWPSVPFVVVITKSYSVPDREKNIELVNQAFASPKRSKPAAVIPVVAATFTLNDLAYAPPEGIAELIDETNNLLPEGRKAAQKDISRFKLNRKRALAQTVIVAGTTGGVVVGAVPIPFPDAIILAPLELTEIKALAKIYGIKQDEDSQKFFNSIIEVGAASVVAKTVLQALKAVPGIQIGAAALNAVIAAAIVAAMGEGASYVFEQIYLGNKSVEDVDWVKKVMEARMTNDFLEKLLAAVSGLGENATPQRIAQVVSSLFSATATKKD
jgi:uncharacterized protein (DUF697 family)/GTPase SAR1 family protein